MMESTTKDLQEPLLCTMDTDASTSLPSAVLYDTPASTTDEQHTTEGPVWLCCGFPIIAHRCLRHWDSCVETWHRSIAATFMTLMLWIQFRVACSVPHAPIAMDTSLVIQILSFGLAGVLFRVSLKGTEETMIQLWPEITTDMLLLVILLGYTTGAVWTMNLLTLSQCLHAAWNQWDHLQQAQSSECCCDDTPTTSSLDRTLHTRGCRLLRPLAGFHKLDEYDSDVEVDDESVTTSTTATDSETEDHCCAQTV